MIKKKKADGKYCEDLLSSGNMTLFTGQLSTAVECLQISEDMKHF